MDWTKSSVDKLCHFRDFVFFWITSFKLGAKVILPGGEVPFGHLSDTDDLSDADNFSEWGTQKI